MNKKSLLIYLFHRVKLMYVQRIWSNMTDIRIFNLFFADSKFPGNTQDFPGKHFISREVKNLRDPGFPGSRYPERETLVGTYDAKKRWRGWLGPAPSGDNGLGRQAQVEQVGTRFDKGN